MTRSMAEKQATQTQPGPAVGSHALADSTPSRIESGPMDQNDSSLGKAM